MADVANSKLHYAFKEGEEPEDVNLAVLQRPTLMPGDKIPSGAFSKEELDELRALGAVCDEKEYVSDEERASSLSLSALEAYQAGKRAAYAEENPEADAEEIDRATGRVIPSDQTTRGSEPAASDPAPVPKEEAKARSGK